MFKIVGYRHITISFGGRIFNYLTNLTAYFAIHCAEFS